MLQINASIGKHQGKIWCVYRTKHLYQYNAECFLTELDAELNPISDRTLIAENNNTAFEDVRLFSFKDKLLAFYTYMPFNGEGSWSWEYVVGYGEIDEKKSTIKDQVSLRSLSKRFNVENRSNEKNWSPYIYRDELYMVTDFDPYLRIIKIGTVDGKSNPEEFFLSKERTVGWEFGELRGGTPLLPKPGANDGWVYGFVHSYRTNEKGFNRFYYYTIVRFNHSKNIFEYHPQPLPSLDEEIDQEYEMLWLQSNKRRLKVIFPIGIMHHDDGLLVSFGKDDVCSYTEHFTWNQIKGFFRNA